MGLIKYLIEANTLCALNNINNEYAKERKKQKHIERIRTAILANNRYTFAGTYIVRIESNGCHRYFKFHYTQIDKVSIEIYNHLTLTRKSLHELSFKHELVRID